MQSWADELPRLVSEGLCTRRFGDLPDWLNSLNNMPTPRADRVSFQDDFTLSGKISDEEKENLAHWLRQLIPWRKGPYHIHGIHIDTEWRSDWKWDRIAPHITPLKSRTVLDVGCGNGYHMWRMIGAGAERAIGIDPSPRFSVQFEMLKRLIDAEPTSNPRAHLIPAPLESMPKKLEAFDTVFSMGVLYHRRSPLDHIDELRGCLRPGGELVIETLVVPGSKTTCLVPDGRYAKMRNVWMIPSSAMLTVWLEKMGFENVRIVDETQTTTQEQRATDWMRYESLENFLDSNDTTKTIEGYSAPLRATLIANKPY